MSSSSPLSPSSSSSSSASSIPEEIKPKFRRTKLIIAQENRAILDHIVKGATHDQIRKWVGLNEKNYWKRIAAIRKRDLEITKAEQTPEAHAFMFRRTTEKLHNLEMMAMEIAESKTIQVRDRIEAMNFLKQIYEDELSIFLFGPSNYVVKEASFSASSNATAGAGTKKFRPTTLARWPWGVDDEDRDDPSNAVF